MLVGHKPLQVPETIKFIDSLFPSISWNQLMKVSHNELDAAWRAWLVNSSYNSIHGLDTMTQSGFCPGTTDAFGEFISRYPNRRIRVSRADWVFTKVLSKNCKREFKFIEEGPLEKNDCLIISIPFCGNGSHHPDQDTLLDDADQLEIPVFVDGAYFGISTDVDYYLDRNCVKDFAVSLSKNMVSDPLRLGIRFSKDNPDDGISFGIIGDDVFDRLGAYLSIQLLNNFSHDWLVDKYLEKSKTICNELGLTVSKTITLATGPDHMTDFLRGGDYVRVCITDELIGTP